MLMGENTSHMHGAAERAIASVFNHRMFTTSVVHHGTAFEVETKIFGTVDDELRDEVKATVGGLDLTFKEVTHQGSKWTVVRSWHPTKATRGLVET